MITTMKWIEELCPAGLSKDELRDILMRVGFEIDSIDEHTDDVVFDVEVTANHSDWLSMIGIAREVSAVTGVKAALPSFSISEQEPSVENYASIEVKDTDLCPLYIGKVIRGVKVTQSPDWLQRRLELIGLKPVNAIVDITNFIMYETGQPLHAFDLDKLSGNKIIVRRAVDKEKITAINGKEIILNKNILVIADDEKPVALAGVMGGSHSEISQDTTNILLECASFHGPTTRRATRSVGFTSDSSARFERGTDLNNAQYVADRTAAMFVEFCGGVIAKGSISVSEPIPEAATVSIRPTRVTRLLGIEVKAEAIKSALMNLGFEIISEESDLISVKVPSWRKDVSREVDLIEEVARITGYDKIPDALNVNIGVNPIPEKWNRRARLRNIMAGLGYCEAISDPFVEPKTAQLVSYWKFDGLVSLINPVRSDQGTLRTSLLPSLVKVLKGNHDRAVSDVSLFEISRIYLERGDKKPVEKEIFALISDLDFLSIKGTVEDSLSAFLPKSAITFSPIVLPHLEDGKALVVKVDNSEVGYVGVVAKKTRESLGYKSSAVVAEIDFDRISTIPAFSLRSFDNSLIPKFPSVERDFAFILDESVSWAEVEATVRKACENAPFEELKFFDIYRGKQIPKNKKSIALRVFFRSSKGTLNDEILIPVVNRIVSSMAEKFGAELRK